MALFDRLRSNIKILGIGFSIGLVIALGVLAVIYYVAVPKVAQDAVQERFVKLEKKTGLSIETSSIKPVGLGGVEILGLEIKDPKSPSPALLHVDKIHVTLDKTAVLAGQKVISTLDVQDVNLHLIRGADGRFNLEALRTKKGGKESAKKKPGRSALQRVMALFGDQIPTLNAQNIKITILDESTDPKRTPLPLDEVTIPTFSLVPESSDNAPFATTVLVKTNPKASQMGWSIPQKIEMKGHIALPLESSDLVVEMDKPMLWQAPKPYDMIELGLQGIQVDKGAKVTVREPLFRVKEQQDQFVEVFRAETIVVQLKRWTTKLKQVRLESILLRLPEVHFTIRKDGTNSLEPLRAKLFPNPTPTPASPNDPPTTPPPTTKGMQSTTQKLTTLVELLPSMVEVTQGKLEIKDHRPVSKAKRVLLTTEAFKMAYLRKEGQLTLEGGVKILGGAKGDNLHGEVQGNVQAKLMKPKSLELKGSVKDLDLGWLAQVAPFGPLTSVQDGVLNASLRATRKSGASFDFEGKVKATKLDIMMPKLAEEPILDWTLGYDFKGMFDPDASIPEAKLLKTALDANVPEDPNHKGSKRVITIAPPTQGALIFTQGRATVGKLQFDAQPAFYGIDFDKPLPARADLVMNLPPTPVQDALDSIPDALLGDLAGMKLKGTTKLSLVLEVPMYDASAMVWQGEPEFEAIEIVDVDPVMDPRKLAGKFRHVIRDESVLFERVVTVPGMQYVPDRWIKENVGLDDEGIDEHWARGDWWSKMSKQTAKRPWTDGSSAGLTRRWRPWFKNQTRPLEPNPYGKYVFVPLQYISPWLIRAILTTEDNSFFKHDGFNRFALRESIERNLAAGDYVRGASTISMQLVKNLFLTRKKVMARKIQEGILVWLMENEVQIPKARLMEIYLNIIEFGPGVFGIHDAAVHYFGKRPDELSLAECAWLVTIVPGPKRQHFYYSKGELSDRYFERIKRYIKIMLNRERVTEAEYLAAIEKKPEFYKPTDPGAPALKPKPEPTLFPSLDFFNTTPTEPTTPTTPPTGVTPPVKLNTPTPTAPTTPTQKPKEPAAIWP